MKNLYNIFSLVFITASVFTSCNYLDESPYDWAQPKDVFGMQATYERPVNQAYSYLQQGFNRVGGAFLDAATDDGVFVVNDGSIHRLARGFITSSSPVLSCWDRSYQGIRQALFVQKNLGEIDLVLDDRTSAEVLAIKNIYSGEMYALRAWYEFDLLRHYGGFPIVDKYYQLGDPELAAKGRDNFAECVQHISSLCDSAAKYLNVTPQGGNGGFGRMTKGAALAIKAKTLIFSASPLFNQSSNTNGLLGHVGANDAAIKTRWEAAAAACAEVINLKDGAEPVYTLFNTKTGGLTAYQRLFITTPNTNKEYIVFVTAPRSNGLENRQFPPTISNSSGGGSVPTQEFVDAFTKADGSDYTRGTLATQYSGRDPRFNVTVGYNGSVYRSNATIYTKLGTGATNDALNALIDRSTTSGYYLRKFLDVSVNFSAGSPSTAFHLFPLIRLADIYLLYAEAMNEAYGPAEDPNGYGLTAKDAVQKVRTRAEFGAADKFLTGVTETDAMREKIKQERRIELSFEEQRYFDLRRWMDGDMLNRPITGIRIEQSGTNVSHSYFNIDNQRRFESKMYLHPIPLSETLITPNIVQNPGW